MQVHRIGKETLPLDETSGVKATQRDMPRGGAPCKQGTTVTNLGPGSRASSMGSFFLTTHTGLSPKTRLCYPSKQERNVHSSDLNSNQIPY